MAKPTEDTGPLEEELAALLAEVEAAATGIAARVSDESPGLEFADVGDGDDAPGEGEGEVEAEGEPEAPQENGEPDLESTVDQMHEDAAADDESAHEAAADPDAAVIDAELARLGDALLKGSDPARAVARAQEQAAVRPPGKAEPIEAVAGPDLLAKVLRHVHAMLRHIEPRVLGAMAVLSRPLDKRPSIVRNVIGYGAIVTAFWAFVLIMYLAIAR